MKKESNISWLWNQCKGSRLALSLISVICLFMSVCYLLITMIFQGFMDIAAGDSTNSFAEMILFSVIAIVLYAFTQILSSTMEGYVYSKIEKKMRSNLMQKILRKRLMDLHRMHSGEILNRLTTDVANVSDFYIQLSGQMCLTVFTSLFATIYLFLLNWKMAILFLIVIPLLTFLISVFTPKLQEAAKLDSKNEDNNRSNMQEILSRISLFQAYAMEDTVDRRMDALYEKKRSSKIKLSFLEGGLGFLNSMVTFCVFIIASGVGAYFVLQGQNRVGDLVAMIQLSNYIMLPLSAVPRWIALYNRTAASIARMGELEELADRPEMSEKNPYGKRPDEILLNHLEFSYDGQNPVLEQADAVFRRGCVTGIIGESGSGKSTLLHLILGLYQPENEQMILKREGGQCVPFYGTKDTIAYVPSENFVFRGTIRENICMSMEYEAEKFARVCEMANIQKLVESFGAGEEEFVEENGNNLSMGQKQRIAIARALYADTPVLLFDEPTANLDPDSVNTFKNMVRGISRDKICILVTHDMDVAVMCDSVYALKEGKLKLQGND